MLRDQSLLPVAVNEVRRPRPAASGKQFTLRRGVSAADLSLLTRQIATLVHSGLPLEEALRPCRSRPRSRASAAS